MKKLLALFLGLGLLSQQASAVTVMGENFAGYANTLVSKDAGVWMDLGTQTNQSLPADLSYSFADVEASITDLDAGTWVGGYYAGDSLTMGFDTGVANRTGDDLKIFLVGGNGHTVGLTIGGETQWYTLAPDEGKIENEFDSVYGIYPIIELAIDLDDFITLSGAVTQFSMTVGDRWCGVGDAQGLCSSLPSFVGSYNVVPVPAAVWLFGSGLIGLVGLARRKR